RRRRPYRANGDKPTFRSWLRPPLKALDQVVVEAIHDPVAERYGEDLLEGMFRPHWLRNVSACLENFVGTERHARGDPYPFLHCSFGRFCRRPVPLILPSIGVRTGHKNNVPWRVMVVNRATVANSPGRACAILGRRR